MTQPIYPRLSNQQPLGDANGEAFFDCVIVGSGFGGAVMAARLSEQVAPGQLAVLERGKEYQPGDYPTNMAEAVKELRSPLQPLGMYDFTLNSDMDSLVASALGGGSNIYANVILEPWPEVFNTCMDPSNPSKSRCWPQVISYESLQPYFSRVRQMMAVEKYIDQQDLATGVMVNDPLLAGSPFYGAEQGIHPATGQPLRDYRGRTFAERPALSKANYLRDALDHIQDVEQPTGGRTNQTKRAANPQEWIPLRNGNFQQGQSATGAFGKAPIAVNLTLVEDAQPNAVGVPQRKCTLCGDCVTGCNVGAKNVLTMNYLPLARQRGAAIFTQVEVQSIHPSDRGDYRYRLQVLHRSYQAGKLQTRTVRVYAQMVVLSAGVFGTVKLLINMQQRGELNFSAQLGQRFSGNADALAISYNGQRQLNSIGYGRSGKMPWEVGPTITAMADFRRVPGRHHLVQDAAFPSPLVAATRRLFASPHFWKVDPRVWRDLLRQDRAGQSGGALNHSQVWLSMGHDAAAGELSCDRKGNLRLRWLGSGAQQVHDATRKTFQILSRLVGASHISNPRDRGWFIKKAPTPITVHPLGGACMAEDSAHGVTDHAGRVFDPQGGVHPGLYVSDGSLCDASVGANPSLTIAALAERAAEQIISEDLPRLFGSKDVSLPLAQRKTEVFTTAQNFATTRPTQPAFRHQASAVAQQPARPFSRANWVTAIELILLALLLNLVLRVGANAMSGPGQETITPVGVTTSAVVPGLQLRFLAVDEVKAAIPGANPPGALRIGILPAAGPPQADILFLHGHADRLDNHAALFTAWRDAGYRVIAFDLPSHGESTVASIDLYSFDALYALVRLVEKSTLEDPQRPFLLAGWSFGGLIATRLAEDPAQLVLLSRKPQGVLLLTPAVAPYPFAGGDGIARVKTLTHQPNPPVAGPPNPAMPLANPLFAARLLYESWRAGQARLPADTPLLVITAGETEDWYVNTPAAKIWAQTQQQNGAKLHLFQCNGARHGIDNEAFPIGPAVHQLTVAFAASVLHGTPLTSAAGPCSQL